MLGTMGLRAGGDVGDWIVDRHRDMGGRLRRLAVNALNVTPWQWAGRIGWLVGAGYAATVIAWAVLRYAG